jgi:hypothetical protein
MPRSRKPKRIAEQLDAALDGTGPAVVAAELVPALRAGEELRAACARMELGPEVRQRHLARLGVAMEAVAADGPVPASTPGAAAVAPAGVGELAARRPVRRVAPSRSWRHRLATITVAAAAVLTPLVVASGGTVPGEALYPVKLTVENARLAAALGSPSRTAGERARIAGTRLDELDELVAAAQVERIPAAILALDHALSGARAAAGSVTGTGDPARAAALDRRLDDLRAGRTAQLTSLLKRLPSSTPVAARVRIQGAVQRSLSEDRPG